MRLEVHGEVFEWRGPAPHRFVDVGADVAETLREVASAVTYGWGMIPVTCRLGATTWTTSLFPKDGGYLVPIKLDVRRREGVGPGDSVTITLDVDL